MPFWTRGEVTVSAIPELQEQLPAQPIEPVEMDIL